MISLALALAAAAAAAASISCPSPVVTDGDSLRCGATEIRLWGLDAPEMSVPEGRPAKAALARIVRGGLSCEQVDRDRYGRTVARCSTRAGDDVTAAMIQTGKAREYCRYSGGFYGTCGR